MRIGVSLPVREMAHDLGAIRDFAQGAETLGLTHLRVPDQVIRPGNKHLHEPITLLSYVAAVTSTIELVPSVIVLPLRQTALVAKQIAQLDVLSDGRVRMGVGVGGNAAEYAAMGVDFHTRGARCSEQLELLEALWTQPEVSYSGRFHEITANGINPLPIQAKLPIWIGASAVPSAAVVARIGRFADGWFVLCTPEQYPEVRAQIDAAAVACNREPKSVGTEAGVAVVGPRQAEWQTRVAGWHASGLTHLCLRTLGGDLAVAEHLPCLEQSVAQLDPAWRR